MTSIEMLTLNVGGRNDNIFEFTVTDDGTPMGHELAERLESAESVLDNHGPAQVKPHLEQGLGHIYGDATAPSWVMGLLDCVSWTGAQQELVKKFNKDWMSALDIMTQSSGRPAPLVGHDFLLGLDTGAAITMAEYTQLWYTWLAKLDRQNPKLHKRVKTKDMDLSTGLAGLFFYDLMIVSAITESNQKIGDIVSLSKRLPFSTVEGKHVEVIKHVRQFDYPSMVALQEGKGFDSIYFTSELKDCYWLIWGQVTDGAGAAETGLLVSKALFSEPTVLDVTEAMLHHRPENDPETRAWDTTASKLLVCSAIMHGHGQVVIGSVHCKDSPSTFDMTVAMKDAMTKACPDALVYLLGMDSNSKEKDFGERLSSVFAVSTECIVGPFPSTHVDAHVGAEAGLPYVTVSKERTSLQAQVSKSHKLDIARKDYIVAWQGAEDIDLRLVGVLPSPFLEPGTSVRIPSTVWPFDHASVLASFEVDQAKCQAATLTTSEVSLALRSLFERLERAEAILAARGRCDGASTETLAQLAELFSRLEVAESALRQKEAAPSELGALFERLAAAEAVLRDRVYATSAGTGRVVTEEKPGKSSTSTTSRSATSKLVTVRPKLVANRRSSKYVAETSGGDGRVGEWCNGDGGASGVGSGVGRDGAAASPAAATGGTETRSATVGEERSEPALDTAAEDEAAKATGSESEERANVTAEKTGTEQEEEAVPKRVAAGADGEQQAEVTPGGINGGGEGEGCYPLELLQLPPFPDGVDPANRELHLSEGDFEALFKMTREDWKKVPGWKKNNAKKKHKLF